MLRPGTAAPGGDPTPSEDREAPLNDTAAPADAGATGDARKKRRRGRRGGRGRRNKAATPGTPEAATVSPQPAEKPAARPPPDARRPAGRPPAQQPAGAGKQGKGGGKDRRRGRGRDRDEAVRRPGQVASSALWAGWSAARFGNGPKSED